MPNKVEIKTEHNPKILKILKELEDKGPAHPKHNILKCDIAQVTEDIEIKGIDSYTVNNHARYLFFSNNKNDNT